jgi:chitinase
MISQVFVGTKTGVGVFGLLNLAPPAIALTSPANGASYTAPATINLAASVNANGHTITAVKFYNGTSLLGTVTSAPYTFPWSNVGAGGYTLSAQLVYDTGATLNSASVNVTVNPAPTIALTSPANGASYTAPATINLAASVTANGHSITQVQFYNGSSLLNTATTAPYTYAWSNVAAGNYTLTARLTYDGGSTINSAPVSIKVNRNSHHH